MTASIQSNTIYNLDCLDGMKSMGDGVIDRVMTSPPYNIIRPNNADRGYDLYQDGMTNDEYVKWTCDIFNEFDRILKPNGCVLWNMSYGSENTECMSLTVAEIIKSTPFTIADIIVWKKSSAYPNNMSKNKLTRICEFVYVFCRKSEFATFTTNKQATSERKTGQQNYENIFNFIEARNNDGVTDINKATYSTEFCDKLLKIYAQENETILDPFMGTGTTAISCINHNCDFVGFEISRPECDYANERIKERFRNQTLFDTKNYSVKRDLSGEKNEKQCN